MMRTAGWTCVAIAVALVPRAADAAGHTMAGHDLARLLPPAGARVEAYENDGYALRFVEGAVEVEVDLAPVRSRAPFTPLRRAPADGIEAIAFAATADAGDRYEAVGALLGWIATHVRYELDRSASQEPLDVVARGSAYCTGVAKLGVALLRAVGIEAREVPGYVVEDLPGGSRSGFHRWIEIWYPDRGWVFSDPLATQHFVPATYLRLAEEALAELPGEGKLLDRSGDAAEVDVAPGTPNLVRVRANDDRRAAAALVVRMAGTGEAILRREGERPRRERIEGGEARFLGLATGRYELRVRAAGKTAAHKELVFRAPVLGELWIGRGSGVSSGGMR